MRLRLIGLLWAATVPLSAVDAVQAGQAEQELFAARFDKAADLYSDLLKSAPLWAPGYYGQVRALLGSHRATEAYAAAEAAQKNVPGTAPAETVLAMAAYRRGEISEAGHHFRLALQLDPNYPGAIMGLASVFEALSKFKTARGLYQTAYYFAPNDPECILRGLANQREGPEHLAALERILAMYDPQTREARRLRVHVASDKAAGDRKLRQLVSPYRQYSLKLLDLLNAPNSKVGVGLNVEINQKKFRLLLDTGASGIAISPKAAKKAGLEGLGEETAEARGVGDKPAGDSYALLAKEVRIGEMQLVNVPIAAFSGASSGVGDGLIGADIFREFLVGIDFVHGQIVLDPFPERPPDHPGDAPDAIPQGFTRAVRLGNHLSLPTSVNDRNGYLFLIDSGSSANLIDANVARENSKTYGDDYTRLQGIQGAVNRVSRAASATLVFAGFRQDNPDLIAFDMNKLSDEMGMRESGILGMPVLRQMKLTLNYIEGSVRLEHVKP
jgi:tetratricopeptide (TPR) repeat protein